MSHTALGNLYKGNMKRGPYPFWASDDRPANAKGSLIFRGPCKTLSWR